MDEFAVVVGEFVGLVADEDAVDDGADGGLFFSVLSCLVTARVLMGF